MIYPPDGALLMISPTGIPKGVKHPECRQGCSWNSCSASEAAQIWVEHFNDVDAAGCDAAPRRASRSTEVKTIRPTVEEITKGIPEVKEAVARHLRRVTSRLRLQ